MQERDGTISACNRSAERILCLTEEQIKGRTSIDPRWKAIHEDGSPFPGEAHPSMLALRTGERQTSVCMGIQRPDGSRGWILINAEPIFYPNTKMTRAVVTTFTDISQRKKLEEQLLQAQKLEAIGSLAGGIAHDSNNILGVILGHCDLMAYSLPENALAMEHTDAIRKSAEHATALTRQLLAFDRKQVMRMQPLDLNHVVRHVTEILKRIIGENIEVILKLEPALAEVNADAVQIEQVVVNLAVNARDAMPQGGTLIITTANAVLDEAYVTTHAGVRPGPYSMVSVSDTGHGMEEQTMSRLFEPFFTTKEMGRGTGLGLSIIYGIVQQSGGHVWVYSEPGRGSTFKIYLPQLTTTRRPAPRAELLSPELPQSGTETILLVEDDEGVRTMVHAMLLSNGYEVLTAASAADALSVCENHAHPIDLLLSDVVLRGSTDGPALAKKIVERRAGIKVLFMSGYSESFIARSSNSAEIDELIEKPFTSKDLLQRVRRLLDQDSK